MFGLFRRRRSKWEIARDAVVDTLHNALEHVPTDRLEEWRENVVEAALQGKQTAGEAARGAAATVSAKAATASAKAAPVAARAGETAEAARETLGSAFGRLLETASSLAQAAGHTAHDAADRASSAAHSSQEVAHHALETAHHHAEGLRDAVSHLEIPRLGKKARQAQEQLEREARERLEAAELAVRQRTEVKVEDTQSKLLWFAVGLLAGAVIAILVAPASGRRSRAVLKDKLNKGKHEAAAAASAAGEKAADLGRRAAGKVQEAIHASEPDDADDSIIADRVRTALGENPASRDLDRINVDVANGLVTLRGPIVDASQSAAIEAAVRGVKGVQDVHIELHIATNPDDDATFIG